MEGNNTQTDIPSYIIPDPYANRIAYDGKVKKNLQDLLSQENNYHKITNDEISQKITNDLDNKLDNYENLEELIDFIQDNFAEKIKNMILKQPNNDKFLDKVGYSKSFKEYIIDSLKIYIDKYKENRIQNDTSDYKKSLILTIIIYAIMAKEAQE